MSTRHKSSKQKEPKIECGLGEKCARRNCTFKHPDTRNLEANVRRTQQEQRENVVRLEQQQLAMIMRVCRQGDLCLQPSCPFRHSPRWDPIQNQRLAVDKRRQNEKRREQQREHALNVCLEGTISSQSGHGQHQQINNSMPKNSIGDEYQYDDKYFDVFEKVWKKQAEREVDKW
jgi:hypothetical protein